MRKFNAVVFALPVLCSAALHAFAQGNAFTYQGRLTDNAAAANGSYEFRFALFDAAGGGTQIGSPVTNSAIAVNSGIFTVTLDFGADAFPGAGRWLQIGVRTNGSGTDFTLLLPRQPLTPTPYAITARNLSGSVSASQLNGTISSNNIGAGSITGTMLAAGAIGSNQLGAGAVTTSALADGAVTATKVATVSNWFPLTIANPTPASDEFFGLTIAGVGSDRVLIGALGDNTGAPYAGAAYLFNTSGTLLKIFTNPTPASFEYFGASLAAVGNDRVLIGAYGDNTVVPNAGAAYLFNTNGTLLTTFTNPTPAAADNFGFCVAVVGTDRLVIGADLDDTGALDAGAAYLFNTNGALLATFTNPTPAVADNFGFSVTVVGSDRVVITARYDDTGASNTGAAYLFNTNGTLLVTFTNPTPQTEDNFGWAVAAVGTDRVLIGANSDSTGASFTGAAYLFSITGTLITTFTNPTPASGDLFGTFLAAAGTDRVLIGAYYDDTGADAAGAAYLFNTNGTLLHTFTNPTPATVEFFGAGVAALGSDRVVIGSIFDDLGTNQAGAAYLFTLENYTPGLVADGVNAGSVSASSLDPTIGVWTRSGDNVYRTAGNVGIGTTTPLHDLHVVGPDSRLRLEATDSASYAATEYLGNNRTWHTGVGGSTVPNVNGKYYVFDGSAGQFRLVVDTSGNVGIGTISPGAKLDVAGQIAAGYMTFGFSTGHKLLLFGNDWGFGIQNNVLYSRVGPGGGYAWYAGGVHNDTTYNSGGGVTRMTLDSGGLTVNGAFVSASDREAKENFAPVTPGAMLEKVVALPISSWNFKNDPATRHVGPMAQDFHAAFGVGPDNKHIATLDADGVALAAIQGLNRKVEEEMERNRRKDAEIHDLKQRLADLEKQLRRLVNKEE